MRLTVVYTNTVTLAYDASVIRSLLLSHWGPTRLCEYTLTPPYWLMIHLWSGHCFRCIVAQPAYVEDIITVALMYYPSVWMALPPSPCSTIRPLWGCTRCQFTNRDCGDDFVIPPHHRMERHCRWWLCHWVMVQCDSDESFITVA